MVYWTARVGLGVAFIISGLRKFPGVKFTILPPDDPVGGFFHAMHETGFYWHSIGYYQIIVGVLVFFNRTTVLGALLMMPVTWNIFMVSIALHMRGTPYITAAMMLGNILLLVWHYRNYIPLVARPVKSDYTH